MCLRLKKENLHNALFLTLKTGLQNPDKMGAGKVFTSKH